MKLVASEVRSIKKQLAASKLTQAEIAAQYGVSRSYISNIATGRNKAAEPWPAGHQAGERKVEPLTGERILKQLRPGRLTTVDISEATGHSIQAVEAEIAKLREAGHLICQFGDHWSLEKSPAPSSEEHVYVSRQDSTYKFGFCGDNHLGSKYERLDVLHDLYDKFAAAKVDRVFNAGNWIDGEARFNMHDLAVHGMDNQLAHLAENYPQRKGIVTYAVAGDDHEGWYGQREGIDIGRHAERVMREHGRSDWKHVGYMESFITLRCYDTGHSAKLLLMHPGGGSAYAYSYRPQKIVESFSGGEKPAVLLMGHYHKISHNVIRNVWAIQCGCTQDQTPFMRKKSIDAHVGGGICTLTQDHQGAITGCQVEFFVYYNSGYYNNRWNHGGKVTLPKRGK